MSQSWFTMRPLRWHGTKLGEKQAMQRYAYRVFYSGGPPSAGHPRLTDAEVASALTGFQLDLPAYLAEDPTATISLGLFHQDRNAIHIVIVTTLKMPKANAAVHDCAHAHALSAIMRSGA